MTATRNPLFPGVPKPKELGYDVEAPWARVLAAPRGLPADVRKKLVTAIDAAVNAPEFLAQAAAAYAPVRCMTPEQFGELLKGLDIYYQKVWKETPWNENRVDERDISPMRPLRYSINVTWHQCQRRPEFDIDDGRLPLRYWRVGCRRHRRTSDFGTAPTADRFGASRQELGRSMKDNSILRAVREGRAALGTGLKEFASRGVPWIIEASGFDYCMIDHEHGAFDLETIANLAGWFLATDVSAIVRIHKSFTTLIPAILDQGIMGIQVSEVDSVEEARAVVREAKYPPIGNRGIAGQGMHTGYRGYGARHATEYAPWANANIIVCVSIESLEGLDNVEAIAAVEGIDMIAYGHSDLSARLGVHLQLEHPTFKAAVRRIAEACQAHGKLARGSAETEAQIEEYWRLGCKVLNLPGNDISTYLDGLKARAGRARARLKSIGVPTP